MNSCIFLDRDGVLVEDVDLLTTKEKIRILTGVPLALKKLKEAGFLLIVISNQTVIARGMATEHEVIELNNEIIARIQNTHGPAIDDFYFCPHHPNATLPAFRINCECRKPRPGMILRAARDYNIDICSSYTIGDRITDVIAGSRAGCHTVLVRTGMHTAPPIETVDGLDTSILPDYECENLLEAAEWILEQA